MSSMLKVLLIALLTVIAPLTIAGCACGGGDEEEATTDDGDKDKDDDDDDDKKDKKKADKKKDKKKDKKDEPSFEEQVKNSKPLKPKPKAQKAGDRKIEAELCEISGHEFLHTSGMSVFKSVQVVGKRLMVIDKEGQIMSFKIKTKDGCKLKLDKDFGKKGVLKLKDEVQYLSADKSGKVVASHGIFNIYGLEDGEEKFKCKSGGYVEMHEDGKWGIAPWVNANVRMIKFDGGKCKVDDWVLTDLNKDDKRKGPFKNVNTSAIIGDDIFIGGVLAEKVNGSEPRVVVAFDKKGKEKFRFGSTKKDFTDDRFGWVHAISGCDAGICVLDANNRRLSMWDKKGEFIGAVSLKKLLDLDYCWAADFTVGKKGDAFIIAGQSRKDSKVAEGLIYHLKGL